MGLRGKFNLALLTAFIVGLTGAGVPLYQLSVDNAREHVLQDARIIMNSADAIRQFTNEQIAPLAAAQNAPSFVKASVASFVAQTTFKILQARYPDLAYREPTLNPTNPNDRPADWEREYITAFCDKPELTELMGERDTLTGPSLSLARPINVKSPECLSCHSTPSHAPAGLIATYGNANGFGWQLHETVGAQIVSMPIALPLAKANKMFLTYMAALMAIFALIAIILNVLLYYMVIKPMLTISCIANAVSLGRVDVEDFKRNGNDEIAVLSAAFNRMRRSLDSALIMLER